MFRRFFQHTLGGSNGVGRPAPLYRARLVAPPNVEWVEAPFVELNCKIRLFHSAYFCDAEADIRNILERLRAHPEQALSSDYIVVEEGQEDFSRHWISAENFKVIPQMIGKPVGYSLNMYGVKGDCEYMILQIHVPKDRRSFRLSDLIGHES